MKIVADEQIPLLKEYVADQHELIVRPGREISPKDVNDADVLIVRSITPVNEALLQHSLVKFVGSVTAGIDHLDTDWLDHAGIAWRAAPGFNSQAVADYVATLIAALEKTDTLKPNARRAAVIGCGEVGSKVIQHLKALQFDVIQCDPLRAEDESDFESTPLEAIENVDLISLHVPLRQHEPYATYHLIDESFLNRQKKGAILINAARGDVIASALLTNNPLITCLDVFEHEPCIDKNVLKNTLIATPHMAGYSMQSRRRGIDFIYQYAKKNRFIRPAREELLAMPTQTIEFPETNITWQDVLLRLFNPLIATEQMKQLLLNTPLPEEGHEFDRFRATFHTRHEFAFTTIIAPHLPPQEATVLRALGVNII